MKLFAWRTSAISGYRQGTIAVAAPDVETARAMILGDFDRWTKAGYELDEAAPFAHDFHTEWKTPTGFPQWWSIEDFVEYNEQRELLRATLAADIAKEPRVLGPAGVLYVWGGD